MNKRICSIMALVLAGAAGCMNTPETEGLQDHAPVEDEAPAPSPLAEVDQNNARPCGDNTIAVITDARNNNQYVFCSLGDGHLGVLESGWDAAAEAPLTDRISDPVELLRTVGGEKLPPEIVYAVRSGTPVSEPYIAGVRRMDFPQSAALAADCDWDTFHAGYCNDNELGYWDQFANDFVENQSSFPNLDCANANMFCNDVGWHDRTASDYWASSDTGSGPPWGGACAAKERVVSCNGTTVLNAWKRETAGSGSWVSSLSNFSIGANGYAVWIMYGDTAMHCRSTADRDDMRFRAESESGAYHNYSLIFIKSVDDTVACDPQ